MNTAHPIVSVLMTAYNREKFLAEAIESVLASTLANFELIIVDDCSTDSTVAIAQSYASKDARIKVFVNEINLGDYNNRNRAASYANGKYIKYWDSDDIMYPHCLQVMVSAMEKFPGAGFGLIKPHLPQYNRPYPFCIDEPFKAFFNDTTLFNNSPGSAIFSTLFFKEMNGFSGIRYIGDYEFFLKSAAHTSLVIMPAFLGWDRQHEVQERNFDRIKYEALRYDVLFKAIKNNRQLTVAEKEKGLKQQKNFLAALLFKDFIKLRWKKVYQQLPLIKYLSYRFS
ncbi:MAG TPA: glycosyltransferase family 2 protein [Ferruginibacter sp.]|jgi:glycosyltransferase involved in cell wall biosynthesis|nr:glycosyltransferase family 2 protein [Chitinophagaceae bacterium]MBP6047612.1 glycosyltransferase family 2 protein [Ferruginibacter sp.]MBK8928339.1 glycosyltransferase family 2 protein [Chitinophagaceae bacterium]MBP6372051.1 glycosyltransferase family 2 protein [Ferruginibacter sp.]MBP6988305.1 glycosyltransferase family 2 protein [Ferruginibacter sp.]